MPTGERKRTYFSRVQQARDKFNEKVDVYIELHEKAAQRASQRGDSRPAEWALSHIGELTEDGREIRPISSSIDKQAIESGSRAPQISIGFLIKSDLGSAPAEVKVIEQPIEVKALEAAPEVKPVVDEPVRKPVSRKPKRVKGSHES